MSNFFKAAKKRLEYLPKRLRVSSAVKQLLSLSEEEEAEMEASIATYENMHVDTQLQQILSLTSFSIDKKAKLRDALQRIAWTIRETRTSTMVIDGYRRVGWTPIPSLAAAMSLCTASLSVTEMSTLEAEWDHMAAIYRQKGVLTEEDMSMANIVSLDLTRGSKPKDERAIHQQRAVVVNSPRCVQFYREYKIKKADEKRQLEQRRMIAATRKSNKKIYEKWFNTLSPHEKLQEQRILNRSKRVRYHEKVAEWMRIGVENCPWLGDS